MRRKRAEAVAKQDLLRSDPVGYLKRIPYGRQIPGVVKQDLLARRLDEVLEYLIVCLPAVLGTGRRARGKTGGR